LRGSTLENEALGNQENLSPTGFGAERFMRLLDTKVELSDFQEKMQSKMNKSDSDMLFR
jgi:hypothetical protein